MLNEIETLLEKESKQHIIFKENDPNQKDPNHYSVEYRRNLYKDLENDKIKREKEKEAEAKKGSLWDDEEKNKEPPSVYKPNGEVRLINQGRYDFLIDEDVKKTAIVTYTLKVPKFMDTSKIKVDLHPQYVRIDVNGKITQWRFDNDIIVEKASVKRSMTTGWLEIKAPMAQVKPREPYQPKQPDKYEELKKKEEKRIKELKPLKPNVDFVRDENVIKEVEKLEENKKDIVEISKECGVDLDEIPDLD